MVEKISGPVREQLKIQLRDHKKGEPCPLLVENACAVHPLRPMACRQFNVFDKECMEGEDAYYTRRRDVLTPIRDYADEAFDVLLPFYGIKNSGERKRMIQRGEIHWLVKMLQGYDWPTLAERLQAFDTRHVGEQ